MFVHPIMPGSWTRRSVPAIHCPFQSPLAAPCLLLLELFSRAGSSRSREEEELQEPPGLSPLCSGSLRLGYLLSPP